MADTKKKTQVKKEPVSEEKVKVTEVETQRDVKPVETQEAVRENVFSEAQVSEMIAKAVADALAKAQTAQQQNTVRLYADPTDGMVSVLYLAEVSPESGLTIPGYGNLTAGSILDVPRKEFTSQFIGTASPNVRKMLKRRILVVLSGLTDEERERWGVNYEDGEVLTERQFDHILDYDAQTITDIFSKLCEDHRVIIIRRFYTAFERNDARVTIDKVRAMNNASKTAQEPKGVFAELIRLINNSED